MDKGNRTKQLALDNRRQTYPLDVSLASLIVHVELIHPLKSRTRVRVRVNLTVQKRHCSESKARPIRQENKKCKTRQNKTKTTEQYKNQDTDKDQIDRQG